MTARAAATATALILAACEDGGRPVGPSRPQTSLDGSGAGSMIAFVRTTYYVSCGGDSFHAGCDANDPSNWTSGSHIVTMNADGSNQSQVTGAPPGTDEGDPAWSPDGARIAFAGGRGEILVVAGAGGTPTNLTNHAAWDYAPAWSPDGARIAFLSDRGGQGELYVMDAGGGSNVVQLTSGVGLSGRPDWSSDGARIAFECMIEGGNLDICTVDADGAGLVRLTNDPGSDAGPDWSADGRIAFATNRYGAGLEIAVMNGDGSGARRVGTGVAGSDPDWSGDGTRILFARDLDVLVMYADGTGAVLVTSGSRPNPEWYVAPLHPTWRPTDAPLPPPQPPVARLSAPSCIELTCTFDGSGSTDDAGTQSLYYFWSFGDGTGSQATASAIHNYAAVGTYTVTLTVMSVAGGQTSSAAQSVTVVRGAPPPPPQIGVTCTHLSCQFYTSGGDSYVISRLWSFGDGGTATVANPSHAYAAAGTYAVTATVTDGAGRSATSSLSVTVVPPPDQPPAASFTYSCARTKCTFDGRASTDDRGIASYAWNLGKQPGGSATGAVVTVDYKRSGSYAVTLTVRDTAGNLNSLTRTVTVAK